MQKLLFVYGITGLFLAASCNGRSAEERAVADKAAITENIAEPGSVKLGAASLPVGDSTLQPIEEVTLKALGNTQEEMAYSKDTIEVKTGSLVKVKFMNEGTELPMIHNFVVTERGTYKAVAQAGEKVGSSGNYIPPKTNLLAASPLALPGQTVIVEFQAPRKKAVYDFVCTYPGHWKEKHGTLLVK